MSRDQNFAERHLSWPACYNTRDLGGWDDSQLREYEPYLTMASIPLSTCGRREKHERKPSA